MKFITMMIGFLMLFSATAFAQDIIVQGDKNLDEDINFDEYKTFAWTSDVDDQLEAGFYFLNDLSLKMKIRDAIQGELEGLGYEKANAGADLLVNFRVFDKPATLKGFEGEGQSVWGNEMVREPEDTTSYRVEGGTLFVSLLDKEKGKVVWQGFASGLIDNNKNFIREDGKLDEAVELIFEEYGHRADDLSSNR